MDHDHRFASGPESPQAMSQSIRALVEFRVADPVSVVFHRSRIAPVRRHGGEAIMYERLPDDVHKSSRPMRVAKNADRSSAAESGRSRLEGVTDLHVDA
ncbi:hypothetical protein [Streptomyces capitiformicae]|uniref:hypothetical protein n=1 Tax=Streptomyces capitiformicae TaxID=2014920 RepID=UPI001E4CBE7E|nr:hypothetical protein [Streptomyces capitiformicae]